MKAAEVLAEAAWVMLFLVFQVEPDPKNPCLS